ncbi:hypothetical protein LXA43DRAFT_1141437 [Ganoderma leucocontextum]|nr:hypothetical protein LXA43DRAFT_1141437 [Ganoderma leucocontextum]
MTGLIDRPKPSIPHVVKTWDSLLYRHRWASWHVVHEASSDHHWAFLNNTQMPLTHNDMAPSTTRNINGKQFTESPSPMLAIRLSSSIFQRSPSSHSTRSPLVSAPLIQQDRHCQLPNQRHWLSATNRPDWRATCEVPNDPANWYTTMRGTPRVPATAVPAVEQPATSVVPAAQPTCLGAGAGNAERGTVQVEPGTVRLVMTPREGGHARAGALVNAASVPARLAVGPGRTGTEPRSNAAHEDEDRGNCSRPTTTQEKEGCKSAWATYESELAASIGLLERPLGCCDGRWDSRFGQSETRGGIAVAMDGGIVGSDSRRPERSSGPSRPHSKKKHTATVPSPEVICISSGEEDIPTVEMQGNEHGRERTRGEVKNLWGKVLDDFKKRFPTYNEKYHIHITRPSYLQELEDDRTPRERRKELLHTIAEKSRFFKHASEPHYLCPSCKAEQSEAPQYVFALYKVLEELGEEVQSGGGVGSSSGLSSSATSLLHKDVVATFKDLFKRFW